MKRFVALMLASITLAAVAAPEAKRPIPDKSKIIAKRQKMIAERKARIEAEGGLIQTIPQGSVIGVFNTQEKLPESAIQSAAAAITQRLRLPVECKTVKSVKMADLADARYGVIVMVGEYAGNQMLVLNPDRPMAVIDVKALAGDAPAADVLAARFGKTLQRGVYMALGAGVVYLGRIGSLKSLDEKGEMFPAPEVHNAMMQGASQLKIAPISFVTYKAACEAGWAPAPDTDVRKAVFERVKAEGNASPKKGLKIEYDKSTGK